MKVGLVPVNVAVQKVEHMIGLARKAEEVGIESIWTFEHVVVPVDYASKYPYSADGKMGVTPDTNFVDPLIALAAVAVATKKVRLATGVNILPQTNPLYLAKQAASLDFVSNGRFMLGVGVGWLREEFDALGVPFERRGARFDDYMTAMRKVWAGGVVDHESELLRWKNFQSYPVPVQKPLPVVVGGSKGKAFERVAKHGQGWFAPAASVDQLAKMKEPFEEACKAAGRDPSKIEISTMWMPAGEGVDSVRRYEDLGVSRLIVPAFALGGANPLEGLERLGDEVLSKIG